jgi:hypothetical protein
MEEDAKRRGDSFQYWLLIYLLKIILLHFIQQHVSMWRVHASKPYASSVIIKEICGHGVDRSDSGIFIFDCGTTYLHQLAHQKVRW